jgi:hypothetical protein
MSCLDSELSALLLNVKGRREGDPICGQHHADHIDSTRVVCSSSVFPFKSQALMNLSLLDTRGQDGTQLCH